MDPTSTKQFQLASFVDETLEDDAILKAERADQLLQLPAVVTLPSNVQAYVDPTFLEHTHSANDQIDPFVSLQACMCQ